MAAKLVAVTGASGFLGGHVIAALAQSGARVRILMRSAPQPDPIWASVQPDFVPEIVSGDLSNPAALAALTKDADVILHCAGAIKAHNREGFFSVNEQATRALADATQRYAPQAHLIIVSSLAAREPHLSPYATSKRAGEEAARNAFAGRLTIIRPPAIYGAGDRETLIIFKLAARSFIPLFGPPDGRIAFIHVSDAATSIASICAMPDIPEKTLFALSGPEPAGHTRADIFGEAAHLLGKKPRLVTLPDYALQILASGSALSGRISGRANMLTPGKVREILHPDWAIHADEMPPAAIPLPKIALAEGFALTINWYKKRGWLSS